MIEVCERHGKPIDPLSGQPPYLHREGYCKICNIGHQISKNKVTIELALTDDVAIEVEED